MSGYRLRAEGELLVLQVYVPPKTGAYSYGREGTWRDAKVEDVPLYDLFRAPVNVAKCCTPEDGYTVLRGDYV